MVCFRAATGMMLYAVMLLLFNRKLLITMKGLMLLLVLYGGNLDFGRFYKLILDLAQLPLDDAFMLLSIHLVIVLSPSMLQLSTDLIIFLVVGLGIGKSPPLMHCCSQVLIIPS